MKTTCIREVLAEPFSAREFFRAFSQGATAASAGVIGTHAQIPAPLATQSSEPSSLGSLIWVDGIVQQTLAATAIVEALRRGDVPPPASTCSGSLGGLPVRFVDAEKLRQSPRTVLSLLNCGERLKAAATSAQRIHCKDCGGVAQRFRRPHELCATLLASLRGESATVSISSSSESLKTWCEQSGFPEPEPADGRWHVPIDSGVVNDTLIVALTPVLQSTWRLPGLCLSAKSSSTTIRLAPHGVCPSCACLFSPLVHSRFDLIIHRGIPADGSCSAELSLDLGGLTLLQALATPIGSAPFPAALQSIIPKELREKITLLGLEHLSLGERTNSLSTGELTLLTIAATLQERAALAVIDLPHGALPRSATTAVEDWVHARAGGAPCVLVGHRPTAAGYSLMDQGVESTSGAPVATIQGATGDVQLRRGLMLLPATANTATKDLRLLAESVQLFGETSVVSLGVYDSFSLKRTSLLESLGLFDSLCKLFASSIDARAFGLSAKDISLRPRGSRGFACRDCGGLGVLLEHLEHINRPRASRCYACDGARFMGGAEKLLFRGLSLSQILNSTFSELISVLSALPKSSLPLKLIKLLGLEVLPLGMPLALLSFSERRRVQLVTAALAGQSATRPQVAIVELPFAGLSEKHAHAVEALLRDSDLSPNTCWLVPAQQ